MSDAAAYRKNADELLALALKTADPIERGRMISLAAKWHMQAQEIERGPTPDDFLQDDLFSPDPGEATEDGREA